MEINKINLINFNILSQKKGVPGSSKKEEILDYGKGFKFDEVEFSGTKTDLIPEAKAELAEKIKAFIEEQNAEEQNKSFDEKKLESLDKKELFDKFKEYEQNQMADKLEEKLKHKEIESNKLDGELKEADKQKEIGQNKVAVKFEEEQNQKAIFNPAEKVKTFVQKITTSISKIFSKIKK